MRYIFSALIFFAAISSPAHADERSMETAMGHCFFVLLSGQPVERRFPDAVPVSDGGASEDAMQEVRGDTTVTISKSNGTCFVSDNTVSTERAGEMIEDIARIGRITDLERTTVGRGEPAVRGRFNDQNVLISWYYGPDGGSLYRFRTE